MNDATVENDPPAAELVPITLPTLPKLDAEPVWRVREPDPETARRLSQALGLSPLAAQILINRGVTDATTARTFLNPTLDALSDPFRLPDMEGAVTRLGKALDHRERIFVHGDYDADGVTSAALCVRALQILNADVIGYVPHRSGGYDLQRSGVDRAKEAGASLILTSDCGTCALDAISYANSLGIEVIVTDHHRPGEKMPSAVAVVNPYREDFDPPPFRELCGAGIAFKLFDALVARRMPRLQEQYRYKFSDLAALGTVADVCPIVGENRIIVASGLRALAETQKPGIQALMTGLNLRGRTLTAESIAYSIGPALNAAGRIEDADTAFRLLATKDDSEARELVARLTVCRERVREETERVEQEALLHALMPENVGRRVLVLAKERWGKGVVGPAASRIVERLRRPVVMLAHDRETDNYVGSCRSWGEFHILNALKACADLLARFGGHSVSAGVTVPASNLEAFRDRIHEAAAGQISDEPEPPVVEVDAEVRDAGVLDFPLVEELDQLGPFGKGNPEPRLMTRDVMVLEARRVGKDRMTLQLRLKMPGRMNSMRAVMFKGGEWADRIEPGDHVDIVYAPQINHFNGSASVELMLSGLRTSGR